MQRIKTFTNEVILYDDRRHSYYTTDGTRLLGASSYAKEFGDTFDKATILPRLASQWGLPEHELELLWQLNADISNNYGTAVHTAMEVWFRFNKIGKEIQERKGLEYNYCLPKNVYLRDIVLDFHQTFGDLDGIPEATLSAVEKGMAGRTDLIVLTGERSCYVTDIKTNNEMSADKLFKYQHQLSFYADMLTYHGWTVEGLILYYHDGQRWYPIDLEVLAVELPKQPRETIPIRRSAPAFKP